MRYQIIMTQRAKTDLLEIFRYISEELRSVQNAEGQLSRLENAILSLDEMPERYRVYDPEKWKERNLRIMPVDNYLVFFIPSRETGIVTVMRIMYGGRDISSHLADL